MARKKMEGDEEQRRGAARDARAAGAAPSQEQVTIGASKQPSEPPVGSPSHEEKLAGEHRGKQQWRDNLADVEVEDTTAEDPTTSYSGRGKPEFTEHHESVYRAVVTAMERNASDAAFVGEVAHDADLPADDVRALLHDLTSVHHVVSVVEGDGPDLGPRYMPSPGR